ncbi:MAG: biotin synthase BioB [Leptospirales bacterium]|jgi:biotin synthase
MEQQSATEFLRTLRSHVQLATDSAVEGAVPQAMLAPDQALRVLTDSELNTEELLAIGAIPRERFFGRGVQLHILNNVRNGHCPEDCGYCAQRKVGASEDGAADVGQPIASYPAKSEAEILEEARVAYESGAFRYCMVTAGRGPNERSIERFADLIRKIKSKYPLQICLSAGLVTRPEFAQKLAEAGLDRYNHNLNTSEKHYGEICSTHDYQDRMQTLDTVTGAGIALCSGVIAGMGESAADLVEVAFDLRKRAVPSIPVNFFIPVPGHALKNVTPMTADYGLRILSVFRLVNPAAEIRLAAGREIHFGQDDAQARALKVASSMFVSGYLNVRGSDAEATIRMIYEAGYSVDAQHSDFPTQLRELLNDERRADSPQAASGTARAVATGAVVLKEQADLRPFESHARD